MMSDGELERITRRYTAQIIDVIGPDLDVPAPDVNTNDRVMAWIMDTYSMHKRHATTAVVTGKPMELGGSRGRKEATGRGCMIVTQQALKQLGVAPQDARVVIQGFGNVGGMAAKLMAANGFKIVAIVEYDGAVYNANGLDIAALAEYRHDTGSINDFPGGEAIDRKEAMFLNCDVLLPAATENVITSENARPPAVPDSLRRRERPDYGDRGRDSGREEGLRDSGYSGQCRRRDGLLLRVGAGPAGVLLERGPGEHAARRDHGRQLRRGDWLTPRSTKWTTGPRLICWRWTGWRSR